MIYFVLCAKDCSRSYSFLKLFCLVILKGLNLLEIISDKFICYSFKSYYWTFCKLLKSMAYQMQLLTNFYCNLLALHHFLLAVFKNYYYSYIADFRTECGIRLSVTLLSTLHTVCIRNPLLNYCWESLI